MSVTIGATHVLCAIGRGTEQAWASARAGIARIGSSHVMDRHFEPIRMGLVPEDALGALTPEIEALPLPSRARRMLRLAAPGLGVAASDLDAPVKLFIGLPALTMDEAPWLKHVPAYLQKVADVAIDAGASQVIPQGRASALLAIEQAVRYLDAHPDDTVIAGGVDTFLDLRLLASLDAEQRILGSRVMDGFIPGEGAAFVVLRGSANSQPASQGGVPVEVKGVASTMDPGHRYGTEPARGEGLAHALQQLRQTLGSGSPPVASTFAGFNGESFDAKMWGVARLRHTDFFAPVMDIDHPADKFGDAGAAMGAILTALAAEALSKGTRTGPALVWAASDHEPRACALISVA